MRTGYGFALLAALVIGCGGDAHTEDEFAPLEAELTIPTPQSYGADFRLETRPLCPASLSLAGDCVYPRSKSFGVCVQIPTNGSPTTVIDESRIRNAVANIANVLTLRAQGNVETGTLNSGFTYQFRECSQPGANVRVLNTSHVGPFGLNRYVTIGCAQYAGIVDVAVSGGLRHRVGTCGLWDIHVNFGLLKADFGATSTPAFQQAIRRVVGHGLSIASGYGAQIQHPNLHSFVGDMSVPPTSFASQPDRGVSEYEKCLGRVLNPTDAGCSPGTTCLIKTQATCLDN